MVTELTPHAMDLRTPYAPVAIYYDDADTVEYMRRDAPCVQRRVDGFLTLCYDMFRRDELIGIRLKGFKNFYLNHIKPNQKIELEFIALASVLEKAVGAIGDKMLDKLSYKSAIRLITEDGVVLRELPKKRA